MLKRKTKTKLELTIFIFVNVCMISALVFSIIRLVGAPTSNFFGNRKTAQDYVVTIFQCLLALFVIYFPSLLAHRLELEITSTTNILVLLFLFLAVFLGEFYRFYDIFKHFDTFLHTFSGLLIGFLGFSIVQILDKNNYLTKGHPILVSVFAFCFAMTIDTFWEMYEFFMDGAFKLNMQRTIDVKSGEPFIGHAALVDTFKDLAVDALGAGIASIIGFFSLKKDKQWFKFIYPRKVSSSNAEKLIETQQEDQQFDDIDNLENNIEEFPKSCE